MLVSTTTTVSTEQHRQIKPPVPVAIATEDFYTRVKEKTNKGNQQKVIQNYNRVISKNPGNINAYINRGIAYYRQGKYDQAITNYTQAIGISKNIHAYINRGIAYHRQGKYDLAIADYNQAFKRVAVLLRMRSLLRTPPAIQPFIKIKVIILKSGSPILIW
ncbi:MAG: hypothetical protein KatS3mg066_3014 [Fischerella sp.]|nr:MAG: hypothetical protein KatS3mg066_3014 [Fischerella sp.]